jgi:hypothetical protein
MHDATLRMDATTARMAATTEEMNKSTQQLRDDTASLGDVNRELFDEARQGAALDIRNKSWQLMREGKSLEDKALQAGLFFDAFEFQLWSNLGADARPGARERLMQDAVDEFFRRVLGITHWAPEEVDPFAGKNPLKLGEAEEEKACFNAVAGALERNNRKQEQIGAASQNQLSMLSLIENALKAGALIRMGKARLDDFPSYVDIVLSREELARRLLAARYQIMGLATLGYVTTMTRSLTDAIPYLNPLAPKQWDLDFDTLNESQVRVISFRLGEALHARDLLLSLGSPVELNSHVRFVFSNGHVKGAPGAASARTPGDSGLARLQSQVIQQLGDYLK